MLRTTNLWALAPSVCSPPAFSPHPYLSDPTTSYLLVPCLPQPRWPPSFPEHARLRSPQAELCFSSSCFFTLCQISAWLTLSSPSGHQTAPLRDLPAPCLKLQRLLLSTPHLPFPAFRSPKHFLACYIVDLLTVFIAFLPQIEGKLHEARDFAVVLIATPKANSTRSTVNAQ